MLGLYDMRNSGSEENILDVRNRRRIVSRDTKTRRSPAAVVGNSDTSAEEGGSSPEAKGKVFKL